MNDFGTGYSSTGYLQTFQIELCEEDILGLFSVEERSQINNFA
ncbi:hypothetical protein [Paenibacillus agricola]|nr:hypothetical protein [Paenibacillus agricola]